LKDAEPKLPDELGDRAQDNWELLFAIADLAGGEWPARARKAALELSQHLAGESSTKIKLLADIRKVLGNEDRIISSELAIKLAELAGADEEAGPWQAFGKNGKPITQRQIAKLLSEFSIFPRTIRPDQKTARGYHREQFEDAFDRYLPPPPPPSDASTATLPSPRQTSDVKDLGRETPDESDASISKSGGSASDTPTQGSDINGLRPKRSDTQDSLVSDENDPNALKDKDCVGVTDRNPPKSRREVAADDEETTTWPHSEHQRHDVKTEDAWSGNQKDQPNPEDDLPWREGLI
jgi:hypothetical protein